MSTSLGLIPLYKKCQKCGRMLYNPNINKTKPYFFCYRCTLATPWTYNTTLLARSRINFSQLEKLMIIFLDRKTVSDAYDILGYSFVNEKLNRKTAYRYFLLFYKITLSYYKDQQDSILLENEIEIDETHLFKEKRSHAPHRPYQLGHVWLVGLRQRNSDKFIIVPVHSRNEITLIAIIRKFAKIGAAISTDSYSCYVNNKVYPRKSKLEPLEYIHFYVNHTIEFISEYFNEVHTNGIESLWRDIKYALRKGKTNKHYELCLARFYFHRTLTKEQQLKRLALNLRK